MKQFLQGDIKESKHYTVIFKTSGIIVLHKDMWISRLILLFYPYSFTRTMKYRQKKENICFSIIGRATNQEHGPLIITIFELKYGTSDHPSLT